MTILHVLEPFATGVSTAVVSIARELPEFTHIVIHGSRNWTESTEKVKKRFPPGTVFVEWKHAGREINMIKDLKALRELMLILRPYSGRGEKKDKDRFVHLHSSKAGFLGRLACRLLGIKEVIYTPHCGAFVRTDISKLTRNLYYFFEWLASCFGGRVVGCGASEAEIYRKLGKNTTYVSNGVKIRNDKSGMRNEEKDRDLITFTGLATLQKDPVFWSKVAYACADEAKKEGFSFCWVGDGPDAEVLKKEGIILTGWKSEGEVEKLLEESIIFFSAAAWEGLPYGVLEGMSSGCALVLRNVPGNRDLVIEGENGRLFNTEEEAIKIFKEILKDRKMLYAMGKRSREIAEKSFSLKQMGEGYRQIYRGIA